MTTRRRDALPEGWITCTLDDIKAPGRGAALTGGPFGSDLVRKDYVDDGVPVIRGCNLGEQERRFRADELVFVSEDKADQLARNIARPGDVLFTQRGTLGQVGLVPHDLPWSRFVISQSQMKLTCDPARADPEFVYYFCRSPAAIDHVVRNAITTGVPHTNLGILRRTPIVLPPLPEQRAIARLLSAIDARIARGRRLNETLDTITRRLYRAWFVEFTPVVANAQGWRHATTDELCARLFPSELVRRGRGPVTPRGWRLANMRSFARLLNGAPFGRADFSPQGVGRPVIKIVELKRGITDKTRYSLRGHRGKREIDDGDILFAWSGTPETSIGTHLWSGGPAWLNQHIYKVIPHTPIEYSLVYCHLRALQDTFVDMARDRQTTGLGHVAKRDLERVPVIAPPRRIVERFHLMVHPLLQQIIQNDIVARDLARCRDALLPELMSGRMRFEDFMGQAARSL